MEQKNDYSVLRLHTLYSGRTINGIEKRDTDQILYLSDIQVQRKSSVNCM